MIISKCVPMEISRERFSDFYKRTTPKDMYFVGYKFDETDPDGKKKINVKLHYDYIKSDIEQWIKDNGGFGGGSSTDESIHTPVVTNESYYHALTRKDDVEPGEDYTWNEQESTHIVDFNNQKGFIEINGGGDYTSDCLFIENFVVGSVTNIVVDNTGRNKRKDETEEEWIQNRVPVESFTLYYGLPNLAEPTLLINVPPGCRGIVQLLHSKKSDVVINATYTDELLDKNGQIEYIADVIPEVEDDLNDKPVEGELNTQDDKIYVDMNDESGFIEVETEAHVKNYVFVFENTELGSMTYIVVDNTNGVQPVDVSYGKVMAEGEDVIEQNVVSVDVGNKTVVEVFHSLSVDIIAKITTI